MAKAKKKKKLSRKEVLAPDEFLTKSRDVFKVLQDNWKPLTIGIGGLVLVVVVVVAVQAFMLHRAEKASSDLAKALEIIEAPIVAEGEDPPDGRTGEPVEVHFPSEEARSEAAEQALVTMIEAHSGTELARTARLLLADVRLGQDNAAGAIEAYQQFIADPVDVPVMEYLAIENLGYAHEDSGDTDQALAQFQRLAADLPTNPLRDEGLFQVGRVQEERGDREAARAAYAELTEKFPESRHFQQATVRLAMLSADSSEAGQGAGKAESAPPTPTPAAAPDTDTPKPKVEPAPEPPRPAEPKAAAPAAEEAETEAEEDSP